MKKLFLVFLLSCTSVGAFAIDMPGMPMDDLRPESNEMQFFENLTEEQKSCISAYGCEAPEKLVADEKMKRPELNIEQKDMMPPEKTEEQKEAMECMRKAMESCGIEAPERPERPMRPDSPEFNFNNRPPRPNIPDFR